jgi:NCS1 family nucleobase:cation symporter-1
MATLIEQRTIGAIPESERHGKAWQLLPLWFSLNATVMAATTGAIGISVGAGLLPTLVAIVIGNLVGSIFMAYHSAQGPQLGLPQMIQSRAQFGFFGAALPNLLAIIMYVGYFASAGVIGGQAIASILHIPTWAGILICNVFTWLIAFAGYRAIHVFDRAMAGISVIVLALLFVAAITHYGSAPAAEAHPSFANFFLILSICASWQITFAPYVSDYSRYLPTAQGGAKTFWYTLVGSCAGAILFMALGAVVAVYALDSLNSDALVYLSHLSPVGAPVIAIVLVLGMIGANCDNLYGPYTAGLATVTQAGGPPHVSRLVRACVTGGFGLIGTAIGIFLSGDFLMNLTNLILFLLYMLVPWSAINLVDFYVIHHGRYDVASILSMRGRYGLVNWKAIGTYAIAVLVQIPFMSCALFVGPLATAVGGVDIAWLVGLFVAGGLHYVLNRTSARDDTEVSMSEPAAAPVAAVATTA